MQGMPGGLCRIRRGGPGHVPGAWRERAGACRNVPKRVGPVKLQTKGDDGFLLCSDRHSSPGELRMAKGQTSAGKMLNAGKVSISGNVRLVPQAHYQGPRSLCPL